MANLVSSDELLALVDAPIDGHDLNELIERVEADVTDQIGAAYSAGVELTETVQGGHANVFTLRKISAISSVMEYQELTSSTGTALEELSTYYAWPKQGRIQRLGADVFGARVVIVYTPVDDNDRRKQAIIDLVRLELARSGLKSESVAGEYSYAALDNYEAEKRRIMRRLTLRRV
jgi:hypothetical protein